MKDRLQKLIVTVGIPLAVLFSFSIFWRSFPCWSWHLAHGFHTELNGVKIWVPYSWYRYPVKNEHGAALIAWRGFFSGPKDEVNAGTILVDFVASNKDQLPLVIRLGSGPFQLDLSSPLRSMSRKQLTMAERNGVCQEYVFDKSSESSISDQDTRVIYCWFGNDMRASFLGAASSTGKFYEIIQSARPMEGRGQYGI